MGIIKKFDVFEDYDNGAGGRFWGDTGAGVLPISRNTGRVLVGLRSELVNEPGTWGIFGGKIDRKENPEDAARRELEEESGHKGNFEMVHAFVYESPDRTFTYYNFLGIVDEEFEPQFDWETADAKWVSFTELTKLDPKHFGLESLLKNSGKLIRKYTK